MSYTQKTINDRIKETRVDHDLEQGELARKIVEIPGYNINQQRISRIENGKPVYAEEIIPIAKALNVDPWWLLTDIDQSNYALADELGLSNETLTELRSENRIAKTVSGTYGYNLLAMLINAIVKNKKLVSLLFSYFFNDMDSLTINNKDKLYGSNMIMSIPASKIIFSDLKDFEGLKRLEIMDALKKARDDLTEEREAYLSGLCKKFVERSSKESGINEIASKFVDGIIELDDMIKKEEE